jgi:hypothetical protein
VTQELWYKFLKGLGQKKIVPFFIFIGAGTLKASAYVPYGTTMQTFNGVTISTTGQLYNYPGQLIWLENFTVTPTGGLTVQGKEVRVYAESDLNGSVDLKSGL